MIVRDAKVRWHSGYGNAPTWEVLMSETPHTGSIPHDIYDAEFGKRLFLGTKQHGASHVYEDDADRRGSGGRSFSVLLSDGSTREVIGPWFHDIATVGLHKGMLFMSAAATADRLSFVRGHTLSMSGLTWRGILTACRLANVPLLAARKPRNDGAALPLYVQPPTVLNPEGMLPMELCEQSVWQYLTANGLCLCIGTPFGPKPESDGSVVHQWVPLFVPDGVATFRASDAFNNREANELAARVLETETDGQRRTQLLRIEIGDLEAELGKAWALWKDGETEALGKVLEEYEAFAPDIEEDDDEDQEPQDVTG